MVWRENKPAANDLLSELPSVATANAIAFRQGMEQHFYWSQNSGVSAGIPALSDGSPGPGSARAYFAPQSALSSNSVSGKLFITSDTSRLFGLAPTATVLLGSHAAVISAGTSDSTIKSNARWLVQSGSTSSIAAGATLYRQDFTSSYGTTAPIVMLGAAWSGTTQWFLPSVISRNGSGFTFSVGTGAVTSTNSCTVYWYSEGTVTL